MLTSTIPFVVACSLVLVVGCLTLLGPAAAKRQPSGAPATRSVVARLRSSRAAGHNVRQVVGTSSFVATTIGLERNVKRSRTAGSNRSVGGISPWKFKVGGLSPRKFKVGGISPRLTVQPRNKSADLFRQL